MSMHGLITVRTKSTRLPSKCLLQFGAYSSVIEYVIKRSKHFDFEPIICTTQNKEDDILCEIAIENGIKYFRGSESNKLKRWLNCAQKYNLDFFHTIDADDPFFDGNRMRVSLLKLEADNFDYIGPSNYSSNGAGTEGYSISRIFLEKVVGKFHSNDLDTEMGWHFFEKFKAKHVALENPLYAIDDLPRLTLDYFQDYIALNTLAFINEAEGFTVSRETIENQLKRIPEINKINNHLNASWKALQEQRKINV